jgi:hypothetical protein
MNFIFIMLPRMRWSICISIELFLSGNIDRVFRGKAEKALPKISHLLRSSELSLSDNIDREFKGKAEKALPKSNNPFYKGL